MTRLNIRFTEAAGDADMRRSADAVKRVAIAAFEEVDPAVEVQATDYFNHSFAPDLILKWPRKNTVERPVYLRLYPEGDYLSDDLALLPGTNSVLLNTVDIPPEPRLRARVDSASRDRDSVTFDPSGLETLTANDGTNPLDVVIGPSLIHAGLGLQGEPESNALKTALRSGYAGASTLAPTPVEKARAAIHNALLGQSAEDLDYFLLAIWLASDGRNDQFPGGKLAMGDLLPPELLRGLLEVGEIRDATFWDGIAKMVTLSNLTRAFTHRFEAVNLQRLMDAAAGALMIRRIAVRTGVMDAYAEHEFKWVIANRTLTFEGARFQASFGVNRDDTDGLGEIAGSPITAADFAKRAAGAAVTEVTVKDREETVTVSGDNQDATATPTFRRELDSEGSRQVTGARVRIEGQLCDLRFEESLGVLSASRATLPLATLARETLPLLHAMSDQQRAALLDAIPNEPSTSPDASDEQLDLYGD